MYKIVCRLFAVAAVLFAACTQDTTSDITGQGGDVVTVTFSVDREDVAGTRASVPNALPAGSVSSGSRTDMLVCAVYDSNGELLSQYGDKDNPNGQIVKIEIDKWPVTVPLRLVRNQEYKIAFWAQNSACQAYNTSDLHNVTVNYGGDVNRMNNDESRDAFCKVEPLTAVENGTRTVYLRRPLAQINVGVRKSDFEKACMGECHIVESKIRLTNVATCFDVVTNNVDVSPDKLQTIEFDFSAIPAYLNMKNENGEQQVPEERYDEAEGDEIGGSYYNNLPPYDGPAPEEFLYVDLDNDGVFRPYDSDDPEVFKYLSMCYVLVPDRVEGTATYSTTLDRVELFFKSRNDSRETIVIDDHSLRNVPVQRNWRTNIVGEMLTSDVRLSVSIDPMYSGDFNYPDWVTISDGVGYDPTTGDILISNAMGLQWLSDMSNGLVHDPTTPKGLEYDPSLKDKTMEYRQARKKLLLKVANEGEEWPCYEGDTPWFHFHGVNVKLLCDVDFEKAGSPGLENLRREWVPIARHEFQGGAEGHAPENGSYFAGDFDGGDHTISNMVTLKPADRNDRTSSGLFGAIAYGGHISNVRLKNVEVYGHYRAGAICGVSFYAHGIDNCYVDTGTIISDWSYYEVYYNFSGQYMHGIARERACNVGGIVGQLDGATANWWGVEAGSSHVKGCSVRNLTIRGYRSVGGIVGTITAEGESQGVNCGHIENNMVSDTRIIVDNFDNYCGFSDAIFNSALYPMLRLVARDIAAKLEQLRIDYTAGGEICGYMAGNASIENNTTANNQVIKFAIDTSKKTSEISEAPLELFPRIRTYGESRKGWEVSTYVGWFFSDESNRLNINDYYLRSNISGYTSAYKKYLNSRFNDSDDALDVPDLMSGKTGLYFEGPTSGTRTPVLHGTNTTEGNVNPDYVLTVQGANGANDCALYLVNGVTVQDLTVRGDRYATTGICLAPASGRTMTLNSCSIYDCTYTLDDEGGNNSTLAVNDTNLRGWTRYGEGYAKVTFTNSIFDRGTGTPGSGYDYAYCTPGSDTTFDGCTFRSDFKFVDQYEQPLAGGVSLTFKNCLYGTIEPLEPVTADNVEELLGLSPEMCTFL